MLTNQSEQAGQGVQLFSNPTFGDIRTIGTSDKPLFCLVDICKILDLDSSQVMKRLPDGVVTIHPTQDKLGRIQQTKFVNEPGLYKTIFQSRKPEAEAFTTWVSEEVLPTIRRTGGYIHKEEGDTDADIMAKALMIAQKTIDDKKQRIQMLEGENEHLQKENAVLAPKAQYTDDVLQSTSTVTFTEAAKELNFKSARALLDRLIHDNIIFKGAGGRYLPYSRYSDKGYFTSRTHRFYRNDGTPDSSVITVVTQEGRMFLWNHFFGGRA